MNLKRELKVTSPPDIEKIKELLMNLKRELKVLLMNKVNVNLPVYDESQKRIER